MTNGAGIAMNYRINPEKLRESWILCFLLGVVMLNYPFLHIFNKTATYFNIPVLILYFFIGWPVSIAVIYFFSQTIDTDENSDDLNDQKEDA